MFEKNLMYIDNEALKRRLASLTLDESRWDISFCITPSNDYLLMKHDIPIDDINNPREAIREMFKSTIKQPMESNDIIVTFGIGLGYLLDETFNTYPSRIFVYEPDLKLLHFVLNNVDISDHLSSGRVFITNDLDELIQKLSSIYLTKDKVEVLYLKNYAVVKNQELLELTQKVYDTCKSKMVDINTIKRFTKSWGVNTVKNLGVIEEGDFYKLSDLEGKFSGQTAMILAAGPSLEENLEKIKANRGKFVVFVVSKALRYVLSNGITPDFLVGLDAEYMEPTIGGLESFLPNINYITDLKSDNSVFSKPFKKIFVSFSDNDLIVKKLKEFNPSIKTYETGGSATTFAFVAAVKMGFEKVIFSGLDLAFKDNIVYADGECATRISENKIIADNVEKELCTVPSVTGSTVVTRDDYAAFVKHFEVLIKELEYTEIYNTTSFGANIEGMKNRDLNTISLLHTSNITSILLGGVEPMKLQIKAWAATELNLINEVISLLSKEAFSPALVSSIVKSPLMYQFMQSDILKVLQAKMDSGLAEEFLSKTKASIKEVIDLLQKNKLI
ncbi:motility associated factor glycosyltransferase family protein [bacterium]|nr:motility associated factor glycosyltransferase family protein [bacterium]